MVFVAEKNGIFMVLVCSSQETFLVFPVSQGSSTKHRRTVTKHSQLCQYQWIVDNLSTTFLNFNFVVSKELSKNFYYTKSILELHSNRTLVKSRSGGIRLLRSPGALVLKLLSLNSVSCRHSTGDLFLYKHLHYFYKLFFHAALSS